MTKLYIDDMRYPPDKTWDLVRNTADAIIYITTNGCPNEISFDYCLADGKNIMPFIEWLIEQDKENKNFIPKNFKFDSHSSSTYGTTLIYDKLNGYLKNR